jgi:flagellar protein FliS
MFTIANRGANAYAKVSMETGVLAATPHQLITMLFDGAKMAIDKAIIHIENKDIQNKGIAITHALSIINNGLKAGLNMKDGGEIALNLEALYIYMTSRLVEANLKNDIKILQEVKGLINDIRESWVTIEKQVQ